MAIFLIAQKIRYMMKVNRNRMQQRFVIAQSVIF